MENWETDWSRDALERIVVLLFALANLADLAAGAHYFRRRQVVEILSHGEIEARAFVIGISTGAPTSPDELEYTGDAVRLAVRFRALALVLCVLLARGLFSLPGAACRPSHRISVSAVRRLDAAAPPASDTS
jgi:hypothetical protein